MSGYLSKPDAKEGHRHLSEPGKILCFHCEIGISHVTPKHLLDAEDLACYLDKRSA